MITSKDDAVSAIENELQAAERRLNEHIEGPDRGASDDEGVEPADTQRYLEELADDLETTRQTLDEDELRAAADADALESAGDGLAVVVGHTRSSPGAEGKAPPLPQSPIAARHEYAWNSELAQMIKQKADAGGIRCDVFFRDNGGITGAYARVRQWRPGATIELHFNAFNSQASGTETLFASRGSRAWAQALQTQMVSLYGRTGRQDRGLKDRSGGGRGAFSLKQIDPCALIEPFFGDHSGDAEIGQANKERLAAAILAAYREWSKPKGV